MAARTAGVPGGGARAPSPVSHDAERLRLGEALHGVPAVGAYRLGTVALALPSVPDGRVALAADQGQRGAPLHAGREQVVRRVAHHLQRAHLDAQRPVRALLEQCPQHPQADPGIVRLAREGVALPAAAGPDRKDGRALTLQQQVIHQQLLPTDLLPHRLLACRAVELVLQFEGLPCSTGGRPHRHRPRAAQQGRVGVQITRHHSGD